jgi:hypothetical protein
MFCAIITQTESETLLPGEYFVSVNRLFFLIVLSFLLSSCVTPTTRSAPGLDELTPKVKTVYVLPISMDVYSVSAGGVLEERDDWCEEAETNVVRSVHEELDDETRIRFVFMSRDDIPPEEQDNLEETLALFDAVQASIVTHTYGVEANLFPEKIENFDYSLGPEIGRLADGADAILILDGVDYVSTGGRKALMASSMVVGALIGVVVVPAGGPTAMSAALVDTETGDILWYHYKGSQGAHDLRDPASADTLTEGVLALFPFNEVQTAREEPITPVTWQTETP